MTRFFTSSLGPWDESGVEGGEEIINFCFGDNQRRIDPQYRTVVEHQGSQNSELLEQGSGNHTGKMLFQYIPQSRNLGRQVFGLVDDLLIELDADHQSPAPHGADPVRMFFFNALQSGEESLTQNSGPLSEIFPVENLQGGHSRCATGRTPAKSRSLHQAVMRIVIGSLKDLGRRNSGADGRQAAA